MARSGSHGAAEHLDRAAASDDRGELVARATQQELADACGSVREVVARVLKALNAAGMTRQTQNGVALDVAALDDATRVT